MRLLAGRILRLLGKRCGSEVVIDVTRRRRLLQRREMKRALRVGVQPSLQSRDSTRDFAEEMTVESRVEAVEQNASHLRVAFDKVPQDRSKRLGREEVPHWCALWRRVGRREGDWMA